MPRIRSIHPDACKSGKLALCSPEAERCYWRLQTHCDDEGRCEDHPRLIWAALFPLHETVTPDDVDRWLEELHASGLIERYMANGDTFLAIAKWDVYQHPNRPTPSRLPAPRASTHGAGGEESVSDQTPFTPGEGEGVEKERARASTEDEFAVAWEPYPRKVARKAAFKAFTARRNDGVPAEELVAASTHYATVIQRDRTEERFVLHGATFFGPNERWRDFVSLPPPPANGHRRTAIFDQEHA